MPKGRDASDRISGRLSRDLSIGLGAIAIATSLLSSNRFAPLTSATIGLPAATKTSDFTIRPTSQPIALAASKAARAPAGKLLARDADPRICQARLEPVHLWFRIGFSCKSP